MVSENSFLTRNQAKIQLNKNRKSGEVFARGHIKDTCKISRSESRKQVDDIRRRINLGV